MEDKQNHPIPQDVTGFQFKLIGDITVKQFVYLAGPSFLAWIFFQLPFSLFIKLPAAIFLGGLGASLAFLPIAGRPMDVMIVNFIKALFSSTLYIYQKRGMNIWTPTIRLSYQKLSTHKEKAHEPEINQIANMSQPSPMPHPPVISPQITSVYSPTKKITIQQDKEEKDEALKRKMADLEKDLDLARKEKEALEKKPSQDKSPSQAWQTEREQSALDIEKQLQTALSQKEQLTKQLMALQQKLDTQKENFFTPSVAKAQSVEKTKPKIQTQNVRLVPKGLGKSVGLPIAPESPNIITGIIKDPRGNPLGNILVEIKDTGGNPVRAFKTNGLGEFASATPLANGAYTISFEDPKGQNKFDGIEFSAKDEVILPIEVISIDTREELRKTLFREN